MSKNRLSCWNKMHQQTLCLTTLPSEPVLPKYIWPEWQNSAKQFLTCIRNTLHRDSSIDDLSLFDFSYGKEGAPPVLESEISNEIIYVTRLGALTSPLMGLGGLMSYFSPIWFYHMLLFYVKDWQVAYSFVETRVTTSPLFFFSGRYTPVTGRRS